MDKWLLTLVFGMAGALTFVAAVLIAVFKPFPPKRNLKAHRGLAGLGLVLLSVHAVLGLMYYF